MTTQAFSLGTLISNADWTGSILIDPALVVGGAEAYLRVLDLSGNSFRLETSATATGNEDLLGPELIPEWEVNADAIAFSDDGGGSLALKGPDHPDNTFDDETEPYFWTPDNSSELVTYWARLRTNLMLTLSDETSAVTVLTLADSDDTGLEVDCKALLVASDAGTAGNFIYEDADRGGTDTPLDGELGLGADDVLISGIRRRTTTLLQLNDNNNPATLDIGAYFSTGGDGNDLTIYLQTLDGGELSFTVASTVSFSRVDQVRFTLPSDAQTLLENLASGDRIIFKTARAAAATNRDAGLSARAGDPTAAIGAESVAVTNRDAGIAARAGNPTATIGAENAPAPNRDAGVTARAGDPTATIGAERVGVTNRNARVRARAGDPTASIGAQAFIQSPPLASPHLGALGTTFSISERVPSTYDAAGYKGLTFTQAVEITAINVDGLGRSYEVVRTNGIGQQATSKKNGAWDNGSLDLDALFDMNDAGLTLLDDAHQSNNDYAFRVSLPEGDIFYFTGLVTRATIRAGGANDMVTRRIRIEIDHNDPVKVS